ncbi:hypothetical protein [Deinococcus rubellus]|uniref:hypothetical protein n=1 Tax=Deinococcus rubellus TaxID=1889240 RepID=UPI0031E81A5D
MVADLALIAWEYAVHSPLLMVAESIPLLAGIFNLCLITPLLRALFSRLSCVSLPGTAVHSRFTVNNTALPCLVSPTCQMKCCGVKESSVLLQM